MAKKSYVRPILLSGTLTPDDDPTIIIGGSQGTSGYDSMWTFADDVDETTIAMIDANCDDSDLQQMDADGNFIISLKEYEDWYDEHGWW